MNDVAAKTPASGENLFADVEEVQRSDDLLSAGYSTKEVILRIWTEHLIPRWKYLLLAGVAMIASAATTGAVPLVIQQAADEIFVNQNEALVYALVIVILVITLVKTGAEYIGNVTVQYLGSRFVADMRIQMFTRLIYADLSWLEGINSGRFISGFLTDASLLHTTASRALLALGENLLKVIVLTITMFVIEWQLAIVIMLTMPFGAWLLSRQGRKLKTSTKKSLQETGDMSTLVTQALRSARVVRAYGQNEAEIAKTSNVINRALEFQMRGARSKAMAVPISELMAGIGFAAVILLAGSVEGEGSMSLGEFMGFAAAAMLMFQPLRALAQLHATLAEGASAGARVFGIIDRQPDLKEVPNAKSLDVTSGEIRFKDVEFAYDKDNPVLGDFGIEIPAGNTVALVGPSGAGKSTILNLTMRFFEPAAGQILIDGQDISQVSFKSLRDAIALVTQDPVMFDDTIRMNIAYGRPDASQKEIEAAAKAAAAHDFIVSLPKGYETSVQEAGTALSGGERQRIAIARAFLKDSPILLLDEPTSSLDSQSEAKVQEALVHLMKGRTVLMIAHRLATVQHADLIYVLKEGQIVEKGTHDALVSKGGLYNELYQSQAMSK